MESLRQSRVPVVEPTGNDEMAAGEAWIRLHTRAHS